MLNIQYHMDIMNKGRYKFEKYFPSTIRYTFRIKHRLKISIPSIGCMGHSFYFGLDSNSVFYYFRHEPFGINSIQDRRWLYYIFAIKLNHTFYPSLVAWSPLLVLSIQDNPQITNNSRRGHNLHIRGMIYIFCKSYVCYAIFSWRKKSCFFSL